MNNSGAYLENIEEKIRKLVDKLESSENEKKQLFIKCAELQKISNEQSNQISRLNDKIKSLKIATALSDNSEKDNAKKTINELVREVDRCIALLNR